jgi:hypothetical protein
MKLFHKKASVPSIIPLDLWQYSSPTFKEEQLNYLSIARSATKRKSDKQLTISKKLLVIGNQRFGCVTIYTK